MTANQCFAIAMKLSTFGQHQIRSILNKYTPIWRNFLCMSNSNLVYPIIDSVAKLLIDLWFSVKIPLLGSTQKQVAWSSFESRKSNWARSRLSGSFLKIWLEDPTQTYPKFFSTGGIFQIFNIKREIRQLRSR